MKKQKGNQTNRQKKIDNLDMWDWTTLVASWRYYEYRCTIASSQFPSDIIGRFWNSGKYTDNVLNTIANQFAKIDHGSRGEEDWANTWVDILCRHDCDELPWCKFYAFCKAWCDGFKTLTINNGKDPVEKRECFFCDYTKKWHPKKEYIEQPMRNFWVPEEYIKEVM